MELPQFNPPTPEQLELARIQIAEELDAVKVRLEEEADLSESWKPKDLTEALAGKRDEPPSILARIDGKHLIYAGRMHWFMGEPESMKSWLAQKAVAEALMNGLNALYIDWEDNEGSVVERLKGLGVSDEAILGNFAYVRPEIGIGDGLKRVTKAQMVLNDLLKSRTWHLAVVDGVTDSVSGEGLDINDNKEVADWLHRIPKRLQRTGAAVICIDHVTKSTDGRGRYAIGAQHKLAGLDGCAFVIEVITPLSRAINGESVTGKSRIIVSKDRPGWVRGISIDRKQAGTLEITADPDGRISAVITTEAYEPEPPLEIVTEVLNIITNFGGEDSESHIVKFSDHTEAEIVWALKWLMEREWVATNKKGNSTMYSITTKGRKEL